jgi:hypothetical protein
MFRGKFTFHLVYLFVLFFCTQDFAQSPNFKQFTVENGLPSSECYQVLQDKKGFLWIASDKGVSRYDGTKFTNFTLEDGLPENCIIRMFEDPEGRIWFGGLSGKLAYYFQNKFHLLDFNQQLAESINEGLISCFAYYDSSLWIGTYGCKKSYRISFKQEKPKLIIKKKNYISSAYLHQLDNSNFFYSYFYLGNVNPHSKYDLIYKTKDSTYTFKSFFDIPPITNYNIRFSRFDEKHCFLSFSNQLYQFNLQTRSIKSKHFFNHVILFIYVDSKKGLWIGTHKGGVYYYPKGKIESEQPQHFLIQKSISGITEDHEGGFWFTTLEEGIFYSNNLNFQHLTNISSKRVNCINSSHSSVYAGLDNGKFVTINKKGIKEIDVNSNKIALNITKKILINNKQELLICGTSGLLIYDSKVNWIKNYCQNIHSISALKSKDQKNYYILVSAGLIKMELVSDGFLKRFSFPEKSYALDADDNGKIWLATVNGLYSFDDKKFKSESKNNINLSHRINDLEIKKNIIWMATKEYGVCIKHGESVYTIGTKDGLPSTICQSLFLEDESTGWIATNKGICKIKVVSWNPFKIESRIYNTMNGLICNETNEIHKTGDMVYIASNNGITWFNEKEVKINRIGPPIHIDALLINKKKKSIRKKYHLNYLENNVSISFIGLAYKNSGDIEYKYRLIGLDTTWRHSKIANAEYTTLPYGDYKFEVAAKNNDGFWSQKPAVVNFSISPPFWHTWSFRIIGGLIFLSSIYLFIKWRIRKVERRANENAKLYQQTIEMEMKFLSSQMNPHFTFNAMNSIQYYLLENEPEKAQKYLVKYSKLIRKVLENNMKKYVPINEEIEMLSLYMDIESLRFEVQFDFEIIVSDAIKTSSISIPPMLIQPYIENAIWHGLSNLKDRSGKLFLSFELGNNKLKFILTDNGVGRKKAKELNLKANNSKNESLGMLITHQRLRQLHFDSDLKVEPQITDLINDQNECIGTKIELNLPFISN